MGHFHYLRKFGSVFASILGPIFAALYLFQTTISVLDHVRLLCVSVAMHGHSPSKSTKAIRIFRWTWSKLPSHRSAVEVFHGPSPPFPFNPPLRLNQANSTTWLVSKGQVVAHLPLNMCITHTWTFKVRRVFVQLEHHK
jgi:hypothetical protein